MSTFITINGALGRDPVSNDVGSYKVARFNMASSSYDTKTKAYTSKWFSVEIWGGPVKFIMEKLGKGSKVLVFGEYINTSYEKDGKKIEASYVKATKVELIAEPKQQQQRQQHQNQPQDDTIPF